MQADQICRVDMDDKSQSTLTGSVNSSSTKSQAASLKTWYDRLNPWHKEDTRPEWQRKRDERFKQWEKDKFVARISHPSDNMLMSTQ
jgi:hypothetical protein